MKDVVRKAREQTRDEIAEDTTRLLPLCQVKNFQVRQTRMHFTIKIDQKNFLTVETCSTLAREAPTAGHSLRTTVGVA